MMPGGMVGGPGIGPGGAPSSLQQYQPSGGMGGSMPPVNSSHPMNSSPHPGPHSAHNSASSPGATSLSSDQPEFDNMNSPGWPRSPSTQQAPSTVRP